MFANTQERQSVQDAVNAFRDVRFWQWVAVVLAWVMEPLEGIRHWGMACPCCAARRAEGENNLHCNRNSRRLHQAWGGFMVHRIKEFKTWATTLPMDACAGSRVLFLQVQPMLRLTAATLNSRFRYLGIAPWLLSTADTVEGAALCVEQIQARPLADHDPATRAFVACVGDDLERRAAGDALSDALRAEVLLLQNCPLDESCDEGMHRATNHEKVRAPASKHIHLKGNVRFRQVLKTVLKSMRKHGRRGQEVVRYEWRNWK